MIFKFCSITISSFSQGSNRFSIANIIKKSDLKSISLKKLQKNADLRVKTEEKLAKTFKILTSFLFISVFYFTFTSITFFAASALEPPTKI